jgi:hypothetical protein
MASTISTGTDGELSITSTDGLSVESKFQHGATFAFSLNVITATISLNILVAFPVNLSAIFISCDTDTFSIDTPRIRYNASLPGRRDTTDTTDICNLNANITHGRSTGFDGAAYTARIRDTTYKRCVLRR